MVTKIAMPRLSLTMKTGTVIQWFKKEGEPVKKGESVVEVLSEKVTYEVEAPESGVLRKVLVDEGIETPVNTALGLIALPEEDLSQIIVEAESAVGPSIELATTQQQPSEIRPARNHILASPAAKRVAKEYGIRIDKIEGTGPDGRILEQDVRNYLLEKGKTAQIRKEIPLSGIRKTTAERVTTSFRTAPHSFIIMDVDMTKAVKVRNEADVSYTSILVYSVAKALQEFPEANSTIIEDKIRIYETPHIGVAVSTERGLMVPVLKNANKKTLKLISSELKELIENAKNGKLEKEQLSGSTFTITNLGMCNVDLFLPIINPPEAAILAAGRIMEKPAVEKREISIKPTMTLTLGYDHRIIDGAPAARLLKKIKDIVEQITLTEKF